MAGGDGLFRKNIAAMHGYVPGEQPRDRQYVKLNTNENPYPPSPAVGEVVNAFDWAWLNRYPDPLADDARDAAAGVMGVERDWILTGNGSDDILTIVTRAFVGEGDDLAYFEPSYSLYPVLADIQGANHRVVVLTGDFEMPDDTPAQIEGSRLLFIARPNAPTGNSFPLARVDELCAAFGGVVVIDEAYADFGDDSCVELVKRHDNVVVSRTVSKGYSLAGVRFGWACAPPHLIAGLMAVKDSYNVNALTQAVAVAALADQTHVQANVDRITATRGRVAAALAGGGFEVLASAANFLFVKPPIAADQFMAELREAGVLVRHFGGVRTRDYVRITIGTDAEMDVLLALPCVRRCD
jgi:histidinol-phosphate aminotransferase